MDFGELKNDTDFVTKATNLNIVLDKIQNSIQTICDYPNYENLNVEEKIKHDIYLSYAMNSLYWMYCKLQNIETNANNISQEIGRVREVMLREKQIHEKKSRPKVNVGAAGRFIRHELWDPKAKKRDKDYLAPKKKRKFDEI